LVSSRKKELEENCEIENKSACEETQLQINGNYNNLNLTPAKNKISNEEKEIISKNSCANCVICGPLKNYKNNLNTNPSTHSQHCENLINSNNTSLAPLTTSLSQALIPGHSNNSFQINTQAITGTSNNKNSKIEFNEPDKSVTKILLLELRNIKKSLIESSKDIEKVFKLPLSHVKINVRKLNK
jgi:hypothetical protein